MVSRKLWSASPVLMATTVLMLVAFLASAAGIVLDHRTITGVPAWLKPAKFAISSAIFTATMAWLFTYITVWPRVIRITGWLLAAVLVLEVAIIDVQAARGTISHFNVATPLDAVLFTVMGAAIGNLWLGSVVVLAALWQQKFDDRAWGWWLRMGMLVNVMGALAGGLMLGPTAAQAAAMRAGQAVSVIGGHTVGGADGGPGLAGTGWSTQHGDLRVPHFLGLHGAQIIPFIGWLVGRRRSSGLAVAAGASYLALVGILTWQSLRGQSVVQPDGATAIALGVWLAATLLASWRMR